MTKNPFYNALTASIYIIFVVFLMTFSDRIYAGPDSYIIPVMVISLFTLSAAVMGYVFCYQPLRLYLNGKTEEGVKLFLKTVGIFACITLLAFVLFLTGILH